MNAQQILEQKGIDSAASIVYEKLDIQVRTIFGVENHPIHLWEKYHIGDAKEEELLSDADNDGKKYNDIDRLLDDMTIELERLASIYEV